MSNKFFGVAFFVALLASSVVLLLLQNSASAYMRCEWRSDPYDSEFKIIYTSLFKYERSILGEVKVKEWQDEGWINFCEVDGSTDCIVREGWASRRTTTPNLEFTKSTIAHYVDFYKTRYDVFGESINTYECKFLTAHPILN